MERIGILGGTFDPIHIGHLITAQVVFEQRGLDKIIFVPCHISPHKIDHNAAESIHRMSMVNLAIKNIPHFTSSDYEITKGEISYSLNTVLEFKKIYDDIELIIGYDNLISFDKWHKPDEIIKHVKLVVMKRTSDESSKSQDKYFDHAIFVDTPLIEISSTSIRERIASKSPIDYFVPDAVRDYIFENNVYKNV
ncbi:MAG: nicotinate-nucleotide adenylyltransferase [Bacteroidetes bacterium]|nr:nicotinate-nucleotide adenylyltransferase [Bacteroidota bacterium]